MSEQVDNLQSNRPVVVGIPDALRDLLHQREAVCAELEQLPSKVVEDYPAEIGRLTAAFHALPLPPPEYAEILDKRFAEAVQAAETAAAENEAKLKARAAKLEAAYVALNPGPFREVPELSKLVLPYFGTPAVDKKDLDALIDAEKARLKAEREEAEA